MKKLLLKIVCVGIAGIFIYSGTVLVLYKAGKMRWLPNAPFKLGGYGQTLLRLKEAESIQNIDVLFVGSSQVYRGFDPRIFEKYGIKAFNLGSVAQTPFNSYYLLHEHLPTMKPKLVVLDLYWAMLRNDGVESGVDIVSNSEINNEVVEMTWEAKDPLLFSSLLISGINQLVSPLKAASQKKYKNDHYVNGGFTTSAQDGNKLSMARLSSLRKTTFKPDERQIEYLSKIIALCEAQNVELILTVNPVTKELKQSVQNYNEFASLVEKIARENHVRLIDYNRKKDLHLSSQKDFLDDNHLDQSGVEKFNRVFINDLSKVGMLDQPLFYKNTNSPVPTG